jgi:hypothetical protein
MTNPTNTRRQFTALQKQEAASGNRELRREKDCFKLAAAPFAREQLPAKGFD